MNKRITFIDLFAGIGGFRLGMEKAGFECVFSSEWDKYAQQIYFKNFKELPHGDITKIKTEDIPDHDILCGGFPCQSFSIAGKRRGFDDIRGTMFFEIARILKDKQPKYFILENVKGLLSHNNGATFKTIITTLNELGYDVQWQVLNSKNFGVPQNRERVFIVGHLRGLSRPEIFPISKECGLPNVEDEREPGERDGVQGEISSTLDARYGAVRNSGETYIKEITKGMSQGYRGHDIDGIRTTLASQAGGLGAKAGLYAMRWIRTEKGKQARREAKKTLGKDYTPFSSNNRELVRSEKDGIGTLTSDLNKDVLLQDNMRIRKLTPVECERVQGFPDNWTEGISDTQKYKCLGNAVTVNVVEYLAKALSKDILETGKH